MAGDERIQEARDRLAREGIEVTVYPEGENPYVRVMWSSWSQQHTWLRVFMEFHPLNYGVRIC
ncbi:hypothetical protein K1W54_04350 [Micromonospora sp. CPCC 205371]|nr:hypothetical protein [Micromonospora sp. CPCC 205371]